MNKWRWTILTCYQHILQKRKPGNVIVKDQASYHGVRLKHIPTKAKKVKLTLCLTN
jgi:hypothetical protein